MIFDWLQSIGLWFADFFNWAGALVDTAAPTINQIAWVTANILIAYIAFALIVFVVAYYFLFNPGATTAGKFIFRFVLSLVGVVGLVVIGIFIDPAQGRSWADSPGDVEIWRPLLRLLVYGYVAYTITALAVLLGIRKWRPDLMKTSPDKDLVQVRNHTLEIPIITKPKESTDV